MQKRALLTGGLLLAASSMIPICSVDDGCADACRGEKDPASCVADCENGVRKGKKEEDPEAPDPPAEPVETSR